MISVRIIGDREVIARLDAMPGVLRAALLRKVQALTLRLQEHVMRDKLSGQVLNVVTGALRRSIKSEVTQSGSAVIGKVFSTGDVKYAAIHEFGGRTPAHDIYPRKAEALSFMLGGERVFAKVVHHPGSVMPERSFMRSSLADMAEEISAGLKQTALDALRGEAA